MSDWVAVLALLLFLAALIPYSHLLVAVIAKAYFTAKIDYQSKLMSHLTKEEQ